MADPKLPKNISAWRLTKAETEELKDRVDQARMAAAELVEEFDSDAETTKIKREIQKRRLWPLRRRREEAKQKPLRRLRLRAPLRPRPSQRERQQSLDRAARRRPPRAARTPTTLSGCVRTRP